MSADLTALVAEAVHHGKEYISPYGRMTYLEMKKYHAALWLEEASLRMYGKTFAPGDAAKLIELAWDSDLVVTINQDVDFWNTFP